MEVQKEFSISLDTKRSTANREFEVVDGDNGNVLRIALTDDGRPVRLPGCLILAVFSHANGTAQQDNKGNGIMLGEEENELIVALGLASIAPGLVECEILVFSGESQSTLITSARFNFFCRRGIVNTQTLDEEAEWPLLVDVLRRAEKLEEGLEGLSVDADAAANAAAAANANNAAFAAAEKQRVQKENARVAAEDARQAFVFGMQAQAVTLPDGYSATAQVAREGASALLRFGIPRGRDGIDAVHAEIAGMYYMRIDAFGNLRVVAPEGPQPRLHIDENGSLIFTVA